MRAAGSPEEWIGFLDSMVPRILDLVTETWDAMEPPGGEALEDPTTEALCRALRLNRNNTDLPFQIQIQMVELDPAEGEGQGRMDITFVPLVPREDIYFVLECKRLNVPSSSGSVRTYATEYVTEGMLRFVKGRYAANVQQACMLGYVLNGNVPSAVASVARAIDARIVELGMEVGDSLRSSTVMPTADRIRETMHSRQHAPGVFLMHHIFACAA